jgi:hypothetical protein
MEYNNDNHSEKVDPVCDQLERYEKYNGSSAVKKILQKLPTIFSLPEIDDSYLDDIKQRLKELLIEGAECAEHETTYLVDLILFLTFVQYILELIDSCDPLAKEFISAPENSDSDLPICRGRIRIWKMIIPPNRILEKSISSVKSKKYEMILIKLMSHSQETKIIRTMLDRFYLVEIIDTNRDCEEINVFYSYSEIDTIREILEMDDINLYRDQDNCIFVKNDPKCLIRNLICGEYCPSDDCDSHHHSNNECEDQNNRNIHNICIDMSVIILYIGIMVSHCFGIDMLRILDNSGLLNSKIKKRICKN